jgi:alkylation response protein AidB-like acyl-CoA dehydrogenase
MTDLLYSDVEAHLRESVRDLLAARASWPDVLARTESDEPYDPALWRALAVETGVAGLAVPEARGGHGASWREAAVVAEELGRSVAGTPFLGSAVLATAAVAAVPATATVAAVPATGRGGVDELLGRLASGATTCALAVPLSTMPGSAFPSAVRLAGGRLTGSVRNVADAVTADQYLVPALDGDRPVLALVPATGVQRADVTSLDLTRPLSDLTVDAPADELTGGDDATAALDTALITGAALLASEQLGIADRCLQMTVEYLKTRYQFGRPIGSFQGLKHRAADLWAGVTQARAVARYAAACVADGDPDAAVAASLAQAYCSGVAVRAAEESVQLHGGIGFTWEHPAHLFLKRAKADAVALGTAAAHRTRLGELVRLPASA